MTAHTPEPWRVHEIRDGGDDDDDLVSRGMQGPDGKGINKGEEFEVFSEADAARIVACVNACAGINPEAVHDLVTFARSAIGRLACECDEPIDDPCLVCAARAALQKAGGA